MMGGERFDLARQYKKELFADALFVRTDDAYMAYTDLFEKKIERAAQAFEIVRGNPKFMADHIKQKVSMRDMFSGGGSAAALHFSMFLNYLETQALQP